jgi:hypothetical protein
MRNFCLARYTHILLAMGLSGDLASPVISKRFDFITEELDVANP